MDNVKNDRYYVNRIINDLGFIVAHTAGITQEELEKDEVLADSAMFRLIQVSESADKLSEDFKAQNTEIPWRAVKGLRNKIVHEYGSVDLTIIYDTVKNDVPELLKILSDFIEEQ